MSPASGRYPLDPTWRAPAGLTDDLGQDTQAHGEDPKRAVPRDRVTPGPRTPRGRRPPPRSPDDVGQDEQLHRPVHEPDFTAADEHDARRVVLEQEGRQHRAAARHGCARRCRNAGAPLSGPSLGTRRLASPGSPAQAAGGAIIAGGGARKEAERALRGWARRKA